MLRVTKKKSDFTPVRHVFNGVKLSFDYEPFYEYIDGKKVETNIATWTETMIYPKPSIDEVKTFILEVINEKTDKKILSGFVWRDMPVWLSSENQFNYKAAYDLAVMSEGKTLPVTFKFGSTEEPKYYTFESLDELTDFYLRAMDYISKTLADGWRKKDSIDWREYEKVLNELL